MKRNAWILISICLVFVFLFVTSGFCKDKEVVQGGEASTPALDKNKQKVKAVSGGEEINIVSVGNIKLSDLVLRFSPQDVAIDGDQLSRQNKEQ